MSARKLVYHGLVLAPVVMLGFLGLGARAYHETYEVSGFGEKEEAVISAYAAPMREVDRLPWTFEDVRDRERARNAARRWVALMQHGEIKALPAGDFGEPDDYSAKEQVLLGRYRLMVALSRCAEIEQLEGHDVRAAADLVLELHLAQITKETDLRTIYASVRRQSMLLYRLRPVVARLPRDRKLEVAQELIQLAREDRATLTFLVAHQRVNLPAGPTASRRQAPGTASKVSWTGTATSQAQPSYGLRAVGSRIFSGPGLLALSCVAENQHHTDLRALAIKLGMSHVPGFTPIQLTADELALIVTRRRAG